MRYNEFKIIEADAGETDADNPTPGETADSENARELSGAVNNPNAATSGLPRSGDVSFANNLIQSIFGAVFTSVFARAAQSNPMFSNILQIILSGRSGGFDPRQILQAAPPQFRPVAQQVMSQFDSRTGRPTDVPTRQGTSTGRINYENQNGVRNLALNNRLESILQTTAQQTGVDVHIVSGGQMSLQDYNNSRGEKRTTTSRTGTRTYWLNGRAVRTGSTRHDNGLAADLYITDGGQRIQLDDPRMNAFVEAFFRNGGQGGSGDHDYMGAYTIHLDIVGTTQGGSVFWNATNQFMAAANRGLATTGTRVA